MPDPVVTVWRNKFPHPCTLMYWGRKWGIHKRRLRRIHLWTVHSPVIGGETLVINTRMCAGRFHQFDCFHADGSPLNVTGPAEMPNA
ncbi:hypothetical protein [Mycolicibacterium mageritense]|uniref:Uncharacterized protein n=1 Tax=Mycolicibacterium mageritense TaxID=53462 RepID=A0AAI8U2Z1_MYCME|nr:hypothetical protein [Mycolicibacterium mageritense]BDY33185.1 hypothetical protein hbim_07160 [Mycolicibacterium mageritense]